MTTERQRRNLKRGGIAATAQTAARARAAKSEHAAADDRLACDVLEDPRRAALLLHADLVVGVRRLTRRWLNAGGDPSRQLIEAWRELRMLTDRVLEYIEARGGTLEAEEFFKSLDSRISAAQEVIGEPKPPVGAS